MFAKLRWIYFLWSQSLTITFFLCYWKTEKREMVAAGKAMATTETFDVNLIFEEDESELSLTQQLPFCNILLQWNLTRICVSEVQCSSPSSLMPILSGGGRAGERRFTTGSNIHSFTVYSFARVAYNKSSINDSFTLSGSFYGKASQVLERLQRHGE